MEWKIDKDEKFLILNENYYIEFERLTEPDWFMHLAGKTWIDMNKLFWAFVRAYGYANIPVTEEFFKNFKEAYRVYADEQFYELVYNLGIRDIKPRKTWKELELLEESKIIETILKKQKHLHQVLN
jgi:hypothetical protein